jgi:hypothetical protein
MAEDRKAFDQPSAIAKQALEQAQKATEQYFSWLQNSMAASPWGKAELNQKLLNFAQQNVAASFQYAHRLSEVRDFNELVRIQSEFLQKQLESFGKQAVDLGDASRKAMGEAMKATDTTKKP